MGRTGPFEIQAVCVDRFGLDGYRQQADIGVTDAIVVPWLFYGVRVDTEGVFVYRVNEDGLIASLRAFWETDRATMRRRGGRRRVATSGT